MRIIFQKRKNKYFNKKEEFEGIVFDSKKECERYRKLKILLNSSKIKDLKVHPKFLLQDSFKDFEGKTQRKIQYVADFEYFDIELNKKVIEDWKGFETETYKIKKKLFLKILPSGTVFQEIKK